MKFILGKKLGMTQIYSENNTLLPVTMVSVGPCCVSQVKTKEKDGYTALQVGFDKSKKLKKPQKEAVKDLEPFKYLKEVRLTEETTLKRGDIMDATQFKVGDKVKVCGVSKGHGFQGVVKRHGFHGSPASHGHKDQLRMPGSIGCRSYPGRVFKGKRMGGHMGDETKTVRNLLVAKIENNVLYLKGAVPGINKGMVIIYG